MHQVPHQLRALGHKDFTTTPEAPRQDTEQALEELDQKFAVLKRTREACHACRGVRGDALGKMDHVKDVRVHS